MSRRPTLITPLLSLVAGAVLAFGVYSALDLQPPDPAQAQVATREPTAPATVPFASATPSAAATVAPDPAPAAPPPVAPPPAAAPPVAPPPPPEPARVPLVYTVQRGDTLSDIAAWFALMGFGDLFEANRAVLGDNPDLIFPGQQVTVPGAFR